MPESREIIDDIEVLYMLYEFERDERLVLLGNRNRPTVKLAPVYRP